MTPGRGFWLTATGVATFVVALIVAAGIVVWLDLEPAERARLSELLSAPRVGLLVLFLIALTGGIFGIVRRWFRRSVEPVRRLAEATQLIAASNPDHRIALEGSERDATGGRSGERAGAASLRAAARGRGDGQGGESERRGGEKPPRGADVRAAAERAGLQPRGPHPPVQHRSPGAARARRRAGRRRRTGRAGTFGVRRHRPQPHPARARHDGAAARARRRAPAPSS